MSVGLIPASALIAFTGLFRGTLNSDLILSFIWTSIILINLGSSTISKPYQIVGSYTACNSLAHSHPPKPPLLLYLLPTSTIRRRTPIALSIQYSTCAFIDPFISYLYPTIRISLHISFFAPSTHSSGHSPNPYPSIPSSSPRTSCFSTSRSYGNPRTTPSSC